MNHTSDDELRAQFAVLRSEDRDHAPQFREVWNSARLGARRSASAFAPQLRWIAAASVIVLTTAVVASKARDTGSDQPIATTTPSISTWQPPTAGLLQTPSRDLLAPPPLLSSVFDGVTQAALQSKAD